MSNILQKLKYYFFFLTLFLFPLAVDIKIMRWKLLVLEVGIAVVLFFWLADGVWQGRLLLKRSMLLLPVLLWAGLIVFRYAVSEDKLVAENELLRACLGLGVFILAGSLFTDEKNQKRLIFWLILGSLPLSLYGIAGFWGGDNFLREIFLTIGKGLEFLQVKTGLPFAQFFDLRLSTSAYTAKRPWATFGNPGFYGAYLTIFIPIFLGYFLQQKKKFFWGILLALFVGNLYFTASRGAWLGVICSMLIFFSVYGKRAGWFRSKKIRNGLILIFLIVMVGFGFAAKKIWLRPTDRLLIWRDTVRMALSNPFGVGPGAFHLYFPKYASEELQKRIPPGRFIVNYAHNEYVEILSELGIVGLFIFLWLILAFFKQGFKAIGPVRLSAERSGRTPHLSAKRSMLTNQKDAGFIFPLSILSAGAGILVHNFFGVNMRFVITSVLFSFLVGLLSTYSKDFQIKIPGQKLIFFPVLAGMGYIVFQGIGYFWQPFQAQEKLIKDKDFFDVKVSEPAKMIKYWEEVIKKDPKNYLAHYELAWIWAKQMKSEGRTIPEAAKRAIHCFQQALNINPGSIGCYNNLGNIFYLIGNRQEAVRHWKQAVRINPRSLDALVNLGYFYYHRGQLKEAKDYLGKALKIDPANHKAKIMLMKMVQ